MTLLAHADIWPAFVVAAFIVGGEWVLTKIAERADRMEEECRAGK